MIGSFEWIVIVFAAGLFLGAIGTLLAFEVCGWWQQRALRRWIRRLEGER